MENMNFKRLLTVGTILMVGSIFSSAHAQNQATGTIDVKLTLTESCSVGGADLKPGDNITMGEFNFGTEAASHIGDLEESLSLKVRCVTANPVKLTLTSGLYDTQLADSRAMKSTDGDVYVGYNVYKQPSKVDKVSNGDVFYEQPANTVEEQTVVLHGIATMVSGGGYKPGDYTDTLTVNVDF